MNERLQTFSCSSPIILVEEGKWLLAVTSFEVTNSVFIVTDENNGFSITIPGHWFSLGSEGSVKGLNRILQLRSLNEIDLHVKKSRKKEVL